MTDTLKSVRELLTPPVRQSPSPLYAFWASVALAISALALAAMMIMGPDREAPRVVAEVETAPEPVSEPDSVSAPFEISQAP
ncbi:MAG: hypothetical protein QM645_06640 [Asticcacaulis sp.]